MRKATDLIGFIKMAGPGKLLIALCLMLAGSAARSEEPPKPAPSMTITLGQAVEMAGGGNISLQQSENQVESSRISVSEQKGVFMPDLTANASVATQANKTYDPIKKTTSDNTTNTSSASLQSNLTLFDGFGNVSGLGQAKNQLKSSEFDYGRQQETVAFQASSQYLTALMNGELVETQKQNLSAQQAQLDQIEKFYDAGNRPISDVLQQRSDISQSELNLLNADKDYQISKMDLSKTLGMNPTSDIGLVAMDREALVDGLIESVKKEELEQVLAGRADYQSRKMQIEATRNQLKSAESGYWPSLSLSLSAGSRYSSDADNITYSKQYYDVNPYAGAGLNLTVPLYDKNRTKSAVGQAKVSLSNQELALADLEQQIGYQVQQSWLEYETAIKQRDTAVAQLAYATEALDATEARYRLGYVTYVELSQARASWLSASYNKIVSEYQILIKGLAVKYQQGGIMDALQRFE